MAFAFSQKEALAQIVPEQLGLTSQNNTVYGISPMQAPMSPFKVFLSIILSPITITIVIVLAIIIGMVIIIKRRKKNAKKDS